MIVSLSKKVFGEYLTKSYKHVFIIEKQELNWFCESDLKIERWIAKKAIWFVFFSILTETIEPIHIRVYNNRIYLKKKWKS